MPISANRRTSNPNPTANGMHAGDATTTPPQRPYDAIPATLSPALADSGDAPDTAHDAAGEDRIRPYAFHGCDLTVANGQATGDCPFPACRASGKFTVSCDTGLWRCFVCGGGTDIGGGNALTFLRLLHAGAVASTPDHFYEQMAEQRRLCDPGTLRGWGVCLSPLVNNLLIPGYSPDGRLIQLYKYTHLHDKEKDAWYWCLLPTPGVWTDGKAHGLHMPHAANDGFDPKHANVYVCEGPWDGMALWELMPRGANIVAVPGCNVWRDEWTTMCQGKNVSLLFDSDHPKQSATGTMRPGYDGMKRVAKRLSGVAASVAYVCWGPDGYDPELPDKWDVRDHLSLGPIPQGYTLPKAERAEPLADLMARLVHAPEDWFSASATEGGKKRLMIEPKECQSWAKCEEKWKQAMRWRQDIADVLAVMFAVCASTQQAGNQLFLQVVGSAGSGKTTLCEGLLVSQHCHHLEHLTGFHSGFKKPGEEDKDCSLISRINGKTLITPEADIMMSSPRFTELMSQQRRIFDGKSGATYKNSDEDHIYVGLRTPWIMAGTPALMDTDQSRLGDRFIRIIVEDPEEDEKRRILRSALQSERVAVLETSNGTGGSILDPKMREAHAVTGGYVDWLRANVEERLAAVDVSYESEERCIDLAELCADLRARPNEDKRKREPHDAKELPTRLTRQNIRLALHLAVVFNKREVDREVLRIVRKVALNTAHGHSLNICRWLCARNPRVPGKSYQGSGGINTKLLELWTGMGEERLLNYLVFLRKIDVLDLRHGQGTADSWLLTKRVLDLYQRVMKD